MGERHMACITMQREVGKGLAGGSRHLSSGHHQMLMKDCATSGHWKEKEQF